MTFRTTARKSNPLSSMGIRRPSTPPNGNDRRSRSRSPSDDSDNDDEIEVLANQSKQNVEEEPEEVDGEKGEYLNDEDLDKERKEAWERFCNEQERKTGFRPYSFTVFPEEIFKRAISTKSEHEDSTSVPPAPATESHINDILFEIDDVKKDIDATRAVNTNVLRQISHLRTEISEIANNINVMQNQIQLLTNLSGNQYDYVKRELGNLKERMRLISQDIDSAKRATIKMNP